MRSAGGSELRAHIHAKAEGLIWPYDEAPTTLRTTALPRCPKQSDSSLLPPLQTPLSQNKAPTPARPLKPNEGA